MNGSNKFVTLQNNPQSSVKGVAKVKFHNQISVTWISGGMSYHCESCCASLTELCSPPAGLFFWLSISSSKLFHVVIFFCRKFQLHRNILGSGVFNSKLRKLANITCTTQTFQSIRPWMRPRDYTIRIYCVECEPSKTRNPRNGVNIRLK